MSTEPWLRVVEGTPRHRTYRLAGWALLGVLIVVLMFAFNDTGRLEIVGNTYSLGLGRVTKALSFVVAILGLQVVVGFTGQLSLGQGFFFGTGAYLSAWLVADHAWPWLATAIVVVPVCLLLGILFGVPALRIKGLYLALVTLGLAATFPAIVQLDVLRDHTNGAGGKIVDADLEPPAWLPLDAIAEALQTVPLAGRFFGDGALSDREEGRIWTFAIMVLVAIICFTLVSNLIRSRPGRALRAIRDDETSAAAVGVNLSLHKTVSFGIASALGGVGGMIYVAELGIASPGDFTQMLSIFFVVGLVVGGVGTLSGAVVGGLVIALVPDWASSTESLPGVPGRWLQGPTGPFLLGALLIVLTFVLPGGVMGGVRRLRARIVQVVPRAPDVTIAATPDAHADGEPMGARTTDRATPRRTVPPQRGAR